MFISRLNEKMENVDYVDFAPQWAVWDVLAGTRARPSWRPRNAASG
jgi:hypothetical protein